MKPIRRITSNDDLAKWIDSDAYKKIVEFVEALQDSVLGLTNESPCEESSTITTLLKILDQVQHIIDANPVVHEKNVSRFGKVEFRDFYNQVASESTGLVSLLTDDIDTVTEANTYFIESWGNCTRIDYGSGHELNFVCFLLCLHEKGVLLKQDYAAAILKVFTKYISIMRNLQKNYWLEPAGSHGVWGLDDYHFLTFLFGASQLATHPYMKPKSIHNEELVEMYYKQYMYFECIHFINSIKTVPSNQQRLSIRWHSPMLDDISSARSWQKIKDGMIKMYKAEVLGKLPIIQHFMFGDILKCPAGVLEYNEEEGNDQLHDHDHHHSEMNNTWGDCCGIKIPSAIAASESLRLEKKPIPFD
ncbi:Serine/threonine-protein phosphatase 2A activator 2 [Yamadazyma tenuis]|uniref:Serine/threonine-protein phosphatase 2A activator n=1 Tax=Candida tenuis (strain ATCC 10573 / BCRC 21748 / CBS 615 / JCM 9827 / NBRC 10315 / NRRL Y-1498 / VKM Y-70) TaxID=590646 RepID=G3AXV1_CANTC|nr:uncharacterized protein CANTEDRAFT_118247 [Yamadazyma tenuis ATCC 10573]EGV65701.1 hypothetical protein CANTEDRAFT_118247 [Yamadazyma tenuis ATCC 10573]WEJ95983.1 Serine/threonine-protein phosphatase 2A activator 2 [Yamadazyma tenuis]